VTIKQKTVAPFDHTLPGPEVISVEEAHNRCPFLRTNQGRLRTFSVTRNFGPILVQAPSAALALVLAEDYRLELK
jgi:hypothetical protein